jgi:hypothetical protein
MPIENHALNEDSKPELFYNQENGKSEKRSTMKDFQ